MRPALLRARLAATAGLLVLATGASLAQPLPAIKPGLWEMQSTRTVDGKRAPTPMENIRSLPPQVRTQLEATLREKGLGLGPDGSPRMCFTYDSFELIRGEGQGGCKTDYATRTAKAWKWHTTCNQPSSEFDGEAAFISPESYTSQVTMVFAAGKGPKQTTKIDTKAKWLSAACGDLKPMVVPR